MGPGISVGHSVTLHFSVAGPNQQWGVRDKQCCEFFPVQGCAVAGVELDAAVP